MRFRGFLVQGRLLSAGALTLATIFHLVGMASPAGAAGERAPSKIAFILEQVADRIEAGRAIGLQRFEGFGNEIVPVSRDGKLQVVVHSKLRPSASERAALRGLGAEIVHELDVEALGLPPIGVTTVRVPAARLRAAAALPWVATITPFDPGRTNPQPDPGDDSNTHPINPIESEGVPLHNADLAHAAGVTGAGINVGVISNGVVSLAQAQALNELPAVIDLFTGGGDEGTAMLEIVHDMAPDAQLYFHGNGPGAAGHVTAVNNLVAAGVHVIAEDLRFDQEPAFQQGLVATAREAAAAAGIPVHSSSGNRGRTHSARVRAVGTGGGPDGVNFAGPVPGCTNIPDNVVAIAPGGDTTFDVTIGGNDERFNLQWSEPRAIFPTVGQGGFTDLNLYVMDQALTQCIAESVGVQANGVGDTLETLVVPANAGAVKVVVDVESTSSAVAVPLLDLRWNRDVAVDAPTRAGSNDPDKNYTGLAYAIGAVRASNGNLEGFSSAGPIDLESTTICPPAGGAGPCAGVAGPPGLQFQALDFLGADGVSVSGVGGFGSPFFGTSAAAPHTGACDALVRSVVGASAPLDDVRVRLASTATDFPPPGEDPTTGAGLLDCFAATQTADLSIFKQGVPNPVHAGGELFWQITVFNAGPDPAQNVVVTDTLPAEVVYLADTGGCDDSNLPNLVCELGPLGSGESANFEIKVLVPADLVANAGGTVVITNTAGVSGQAFDPDPFDNEVSDSVFVEDLADLTVAKVCKPDTRRLLAGEEGTCTVVVDNHGPSWARDVVVLDTMVSDGLFEVTSAQVVEGAPCTVMPSTTPVTSDRFTVICNVGDLEPATVGSSGRELIQVTVRATEALDINDLSRVVSTLTPDPDVANNEAQGAISVEAVADLALTKTGPTPVVAGLRFAYSLEIDNFGPSTAVNVVLEDVLPAGVIIEEVNPGPFPPASCNAGVPGDPFLPTTCDFGTMSPGDVRQVTILVTVLPDVPAGTILHNDARVSSDTLDVDNANNLASVDTLVEAEADLVVTKSDSPDPVVAGAPLTYEIVVTNDGPSTALGITLSDDLPDAGLVSFTGTTISGGTGTCVLLAGPDQIVECDLNDLDPGAMVTVFIDVVVDPAVPDGAVLSDTVAVASTTPDPDLANNTATEDTAVIARADLEILKDGNFPAGNPSGTIIYKIDVTNLGLSDAQGVAVVDTLPADPNKLRFEFVTDGRCSYDEASHTVSCDFGTLPAGETIHFEIQVDAKGKLGLITNVVEVSSTTLDPDPANNVAEKDMIVKGGTGDPGGPGGGRGR